MPTARADTATTNANTAVKIAVLGNDSGSSLTILSVTAPSNGTAKINTDKTITYTPKTGYTGTDTFRYTIRDGGGAKASTKVTVTVRNRVPVAGADSAVTDAGTPVTIAVLANDSDPDGHALKVNAVTQPANGAVLINPDKTVTYTPAAGFTGSDGFTYTVGDGRGGTATGTVSVTVRNRAPLAGADAATTDAGVPIAIAVLANDSDPDGHPLTVSAVTQPANGAAAINGGQTVTYTPQPGFTGSDSFTYTVADGRGGTAQGAVAITVRNRAPLAAADTVTTDAGVPIAIAVLANDSDPDGHPLTVSAVTQPANGAAAINGGQTVTYTPQPGFTGSDSFGYTVADGRGGRRRVPSPSPSATGRRSPPTTRSRPTRACRSTSPCWRTTTIPTAMRSASARSPSRRMAPPGSTPTGRSATPRRPATPAATASATRSAMGVAARRKGTVSVTVRNRAPLAGADSATTAAGTPVTIAVLANDNDPDGHALTVATVTTPVGGSAVANADGTIAYAPTAGFVGTGSFAYTVSDGHGGSASAAVTVQVSAPALGEPFSDGTFFTDGTGWTPAA